MTQTLNAPTTGIAPKARHSTVALAVSDCLVLLGRGLRHVLRDPQQLFQAVSLPIIMLLLFRYLLGGAIQTGQTYVDYVVAGLLVISMAFNSTSTVIAVTDDMRNGIVERLRSMPILPGAVLVGHVISAVLRSFLSVAVMVLFGLVVGFRPHADFVDWLGALGILLLFITAVSWIAVLLGLIAKTPEGASGLGMILVFIPYASSALVPVSTMAPGLRTVVRYQPVTPVIDTVRALLTGTPLGNSGWIALVWWLVILAVAVPLALRRFKRRLSI